MSLAKLVLAVPLVAAFLKWLVQLLPVLSMGGGIQGLWPLLMTSSAIVGLFTVGWRLPKKPKRCAIVLSLVGLILFVGELPDPKREWKSDT